MTRDLLGLKLSDALEILREVGEPEPEIQNMLPEKNPEGTQRVVRVRPGALLTARFRDAVDL